jgi:hypothetical protein
MDLVLEGGSFGRRWFRSEAIHAKCDDDEGNGSSPSQVVDAKPRFHCHRAKEIPLKNRRNANRRGKNRLTIAPGRLSARGVQWIAWWLAGGPAGGELRRGIPTSDLRITATRPLVSPAIPESELPMPGRLGELVSGMEQLF